MLAVWGPEQLLRQGPPFPRANPTAAACPGLEGPAGEEGPPSAVLPPGCEGGLWKPRARLAAPSQTPAPQPRGPLF